MRKRKHISFVVILFLVISFIGAQNSDVSLTRTKDSLKLELKKAKHDSTRCNILNYLVEIEYDESIWPKYNEEVKQIAERNLKSIEPNSALGIFFQKRLAETYNNIGYIQNNKGNINEALKNYKISITIQEKINYKRGLGAAYNNMGNVYQNLGKSDTALIYFLKGLKVLESISDIQGMAYSYDNIGNVYKYRGVINKALEFFFKALKLQEKAGDKAGIANVLSNIGIVYYQQEEYKKALEFYLKALKASESIGDKLSIANAYNNIGTVYEKFNDFENAIVYENKALALYEEMGSVDGVANTSGNLGLIYSVKGELEKALKFYGKALFYQEQLQNMDGMTNTLNNISGIYYEKHNYEEALKYCQKSFNNAKLLGYPDKIRNAALQLFTIYKAKGDYEKAFENYSLYITMRDSINNQETKKASIKSQLKYEYEKQAAADSVKHAEQQHVKDAQLAAQSASLKQERTQRYVLYGGLVLVAGFLVVVINRFRLTQKQKKMIEMQKVRVDSAYEKLHEKNKEVLDSIHYAKRIQRALITSESYIEKQLNKLIKN